MTCDTCHNMKMLGSIRNVSKWLCICAVIYDERQRLKVTQVLFSSAPCVNKHIHNAVIESALQGAYNSMKSNEIL